jgi:ferredoxin
MATVWIDGDACMGAGTCSQIAPQVFHQRGDGLWAVKEDAAHFGETVVFDGLSAAGHGPDGSDGVARVPEPLLEMVLEAAEECPGECIFVEA